MSFLRIMEEIVNENEAVQQPEQPAAAHPNKHSITGLIKTMWPAYLIEIFVIILGISITLALEAWRDNQKENALEAVYLKNLATDVQTDLQSLHFTIASTRSLLANGNELLGYFKNPSPGNLPSNKLNSDIRSILERPKFISADATFSDLKNSGNLHLIKNIQLKNLLFAYYNHTQNIKENQDAEQMATIGLAGTYFLKRFPLADSSDHVLSRSAGNEGSWSNDVEFLNNVLLRVSNRKELLEAYLKADSLAKGLRGALGEK